jgi:two-component system chemotaxis response regulator CheY
MRKLRILIVDDSSVMRRIVERCLRQAGLEIEAVLEASNGAEALGLLQNQTVDLILSDINMPVMDGLELVEALHASGQAQKIPVVMITTEGSESHVVKALAQGARGYIRKPFTAEQVKEHVLPLLEVRS